MRALPTRPSASRERGFTLVELMIVVAIIGILSAVAFPSYQAYILKTRRAAAAGCMTELSQWMERNYTTCLAYDVTGAGCGTALVTAQLPALSCRAELGTTYTFQFAAAPTASAYTLQAIPGGAQLNDTGCGTLSLTQAGARAVTGSKGAAECWK